MIKDKTIPQISVIAYSLQLLAIVATVSDGKHSCDITADRAEFENWLTDGTGIVNMSIYHQEGSIVKETPIQEPIEQYWQQGEEVNNSPVLLHLRTFLTRNERARTLTRLEMAKQHLMDLCAELEDAKREEAYASINEYGKLQQRIGELEAA